MKKRVTLVLALCALALAIPLSAAAGNGPSNKVTGDMWYTNGTYGWANFTFSGHDVGPSAVDKGTAYYADGSGSYHAKATNVVVGSESATMSVRVTSSTHPDVPVGFEFTVTFYDGGEPGTSDYFTFEGVPTHFVAEAGQLPDHRLHDGGKVHDSLFGNPQRREAAGVGFNLADLLRSQPAEPCQAVGRAALLQILQPRLQRSEP